VGPRPLCRHRGDVAGTADALGHSRRSALSVTVDLYARAREGAVAGAVAAVGKALTGGDR
jgi:hypothetical protein